MVHKPTPYFPDDTAQFHAAPAATAEAAPALLGSTTTKRLKPGNRGTRLLLQRYGADLLCVRHRVDQITGSNGLGADRLWRNSATPANQGGRGRVECRHKLRRISGHFAHLLKLQKRIVKDDQYWQSRHVYYSNRISMCCNKWLNMDTCSCRPLR